MYDTKELGIKVKRARELRSKRSDIPFTQKRLAAKIGETSKWVQKLESGQLYPDWDQINLIADICGVSLEFLTGERFRDDIEYQDAIKGGRVARTIPEDELHI